MLTPLSFLVLVAAALHLLLAGAGVVRLLVQFPSRRALDPVDLARYFRATDLARGFWLYPLLGAGGPVVTWTAFGLALTTAGGGDVLLLLAASSVLAALHVFTTTRAAPVMMRIGHAEDRADRLAPLIERFARWSRPRTVLQVLTAGTLTWALMVLAPASSFPVVLAILVPASLALESVLAGAAADQVIVHLPARTKLGDAAYAAYLQAVDLTIGRRVYPAIGLSSNVALTGVLLVSLVTLDPWPTAVLAVCALAASLAALVATRISVPAIAGLARATNRPPAAALDAFVRLGRRRAAGLLLAWALLLTLIVVG